MNRRRLAAERAPLAPGRTRITDTVHYGIVDALDARDGEQARAAVRRHFDVWSDLVGGIAPDRTTVDEQTQVVLAVTRHSTGRSSRDQ